MNDGSRLLNFREKMAQNTRVVAHGERRLLYKIEKYGSNVVVIRGILV